MIDIMLPELQKVPSRREISVFLKKFNFKILCEVGVRDGENLCNILKAEPTEMVAVDIWKEDTNFRSRNPLYFSQADLDRQLNVVIGLQKTHPSIRIVRDLSVEAAKQFPDNYFDYVYIDADHSYEAVRDDIKAWYPKVRQFGVLGGHDYIRNQEKIFEGVNKAVNEFISAYKLCTHFEISNSWYTIKP
jgi:hypothetical protein